MSQTHRERSHHESDDSEYEGQEGHPGKHLVVDNERCAEEGADDRPSDQKDRCRLEPARPDALASNQQNDDDAEECPEQQQIDSVSHAVSLA
jgi:hypothetical protein